MHNVGMHYPEPGKMLFYDLGPLPELGQSQILIRTLYTGITNGTERHALLGEHYWSRESAFPGRHGYQHVGTVEATGKAVSEFEPGDLVFCGEYVGHRGWLVVDQSALCVRLPTDVDAKHCALLGVAGVAMRGVRRFRVGPGQRVWVAGAGPIGLFAAQFADTSGAAVTVTDVNEARLSVASQLGARRVVSAADNTCTAVLKEGGPYNCIIDACGVEALLSDIWGAGLLAKGGVVGMLAVRSMTVFPWAMLHGPESSIEGSCHFHKDDLGAVLSLIRQGRARIEPMVTHLLPIEQAPAIYATLRDRPAELLGVIFDWTI
jgi:2-desacetyl-2-hydroxyethyl bacteriochlorophyllide A dehydrogenase